MTIKYQFLILTLILRMIEGKDEARKAYTVIISPSEQMVVRLKYRIDHLDR